MWLWAGCTPLPTQVEPTHLANLQVTSQVSEDSTVLATIAPFKAIFNQQMQQVIGQSAKRMSKNDVESHLGNFVVDAILTQARILHSTPVDLAVINNGGLRAPLPAGNITVSHVYELMPFENTLYIVELDSAAVMRLFNGIPTRYSTSVANSVVLFKEDQVHKLFINGVPFDPQKKYLLAVSDYLAEGGLRSLQGATIVARYQHKIRDMIMDHVKWHQGQDRKIDAEIEGRVKILDHAE